MIDKLKGLLTKADKKYLLGLLFFSMFISIIETVGVSVIMPFIAVATDFNIIHTNEYYLKVYNLFNFSSDVNFVVFFGVLLVVFYFFRSSINLYYFFHLTKFTQSRYHLLSYRLFENFMKMPYKKFIRRNSSTMTKSIITEALGLMGLISAVLFMVSEIFIIILIYAIMIYVNWQVTLTLTIFLVLNSFLMLKTISPKVKEAGKIREVAQKSFYEVINKSFGNFKLIKLHSDNDFLFEEFTEHSLKFAKAKTINDTLSHVPRLFLEALGFIIVVVAIVYFVWNNNTNIATILPTISMFVLALYRLMPSVNRIMTSYNHILFFHKALDIIHDDLTYDRERLGDEKLHFNHKIHLQNIQFEYKQDKPVLKNVGLTIEFGEKIAFIGESGSGKSTLVDIIIGLYRPKSGTMTIDNKEVTYANVKDWRRKIGYIPQFVYLFEGTIAENIAFGEKVDEARVISVLKQANIYDFLEKQDGINTKVGEGGISLSGGQRQRIAIARALYSKPEILVLDEATSALDTEIESKIMDEIYSICKNKTLIIIAHRLSTISRCDKVYTLKEGNLYEN